MKERKLAEIVSSLIGLNLRWLLTWRKDLGRDGLSLHDEIEDVPGFTLNYYSEKSTSLMT